MQFIGKNVYYRATDTFYIHIPMLLGEVVSFLPDGRIIPEQTTAYEMQVTSGQIQFSREGMESYMRETIFSRIGKQLSEAKLTFQEPNRLTLSGQYMRRFPFNISFEAHLGDDNTIYCKMKDVHILGAPVQFFINRFKIPLTSVLNINALNAAIAMTDREIIINPSKFAPGLTLSGDITSFHISGEEFNITYGDGCLPEESDRPCGEGGYLKLDGGLLQVRPFTINEPDILVWSESYPFVFSSDSYPYFMALGKTQVNLNREAVLTLPLMSECTTPENKELLNAFLPPHLQVEI